MFFLRGELLSNGEEMHGKRAGAAEDERSSTISLQRSFTAK